MEGRQFGVSCTETPGAIPKNVPCLAQVEGGLAPLGSGGGSVPPDATLRAFASHYAVPDNVGYTKKIIISVPVSFNSGHLPTSAKIEEVRGSRAGHWTWSPMLRKKWLTRCTLSATSGL